MAVTVAAYGNTLSINTCQNSGDWTGETPVLTTDFYKEGTGCMGFTVRGGGANDVTISGTWNLSGKHLRLWWMSVAIKELDPVASNGLQIILGDATNTAYYTVGGGDTYPGGWWNLVLDCDRTPTSGTAPTLTAVTTIGVRMNHTGTAKNAQNTWIDMIHCCDGLSVYGDDAGGYFDFDNIFSADDSTTNGWGVIRKISGVFYLTGMLRFGDSAGTNSTKFQAKSQVVVFEDRPVDSALYDFDIEDNGTGTTEFILGDKVGGKGVQGCVVRVEDSSQTGVFTIDAKTDTDVDNFKLYGSSFYGAGDMWFSKSATSAEVLGCSFEACGQIDPFTCDVRDSFFINTSHADAAVLWNESIDIVGCAFIANTAGAGIEMPSAVGTPYAYDNLTFSGNTYDVYNSSGSAISINKNNGSDPTSSEGAAVTFLGVSVDTVITVKDVTDFSLIENARVLLEASAGSGDLYYNQAVTSVSRSGTTVTVNHSGHNLGTNDWIHVKGCTENEYNIVAQVTYVDANNYTYQIGTTPSSPATGSPTVTGVIFNSLTNASGVVSDTRSWANDQPVSGRARRSTSSPLYKNQPIVETIDKDTGLAVTVYVIPDE